MAKLIRVTSVPFGSTAPAQTVEEFGSKTQLGIPNYTTDPAQIQQLAAWTNGWTAAIATANKAPYVQDMNAFCLVDSYQISYMLQQGIPEWDASTTYYKGSYVQDPSGNGQRWYSLQDVNLNNAPPASASNAFWQWDNPPQIPVGTSLDFMGITTPSGFLGEDGSAVSRATYSALFGVITTQIIGTFTGGTAIVTGIPSTANLRAGFYVSGTGIATNSQILSVDSANQVTLTLNTLSNQSGVTLTYAPWGVGDGSTTFNLPDTRRRVAVGDGGAATGTLGNVIGATGGEETHTLTTPEIPAHTHSLPSQNATVNFGGGGNVQQSTGQNPANPTGSTGGGGAHNNVQPSYVVTKIIKF